MKREGKAMFNGKQDNDYQDTTVTNNGFWPDLNAGEFEKRRGLPCDIDTDTIAMALAVAMNEVNKELLEYQTLQQGNGHQTAADITGQPSIGDKNTAIILYEKAVFARAKAQLLPEVSTVSMRDKGENLAQSEAITTESFMSESLRHIRTLLGRSHSGIELL